MWEAVETSPGVYNTTYLDAVKVLINKLGEKGIYTLVDSHQDAFSRKFCGEGFPEFYADEDLMTECTGAVLPWLYKVFGLCKSMTDYGFSFNAQGNPLIKDC